MTLNDLDRALGPHPDVEYFASAGMPELPDWCDECEAFSIGVFLTWTSEESTGGSAEACLACARRALDHACGDHMDRTPIVVEVPAALLDGKGVAAA